MTLEANNNNNNSNNNISYKVNNIHGYFINSYGELKIDETQLSAFKPFSSQFMKDYDSRKNFVDFFISAEYFDLSLGFVDDVEITSTHRSISVKLRNKNNGFAIISLSFDTFIGLHVDNKYHDKNSIESMLYKLLDYYDRTFDRINRINRITYIYNKNFSEQICKKYLVEDLKNNIADFL
jgi:hypothetical protein